MFGGLIQGEFTVVNGTIAGSVSLTYDGMTISIGFAKASTNDMTMNGRTTTYTLQDSRWVPLGLDLLGENDGDHLGSSVALSGDRTRLSVGVDQYNISTDLTDTCGETTSKASLDNAAYRLEDNDLSNRFEMKLCALD